MSSRIAKSLHDYAHEIHRAAHGRPELISVAERMLADAQELAWHADGIELTWRPETPALGVAM